MSETMVIPPPEMDYIDTAEAAKIVGLQASTLNAWRSTKKIDEQPPYYRVGRYIRYRRDECYAWLASCRVSAA